MPAEKEYIAAAQRIYAEPSDDDIVVYDDAEIHDSSDDGAWVQAWVFVRDEQALEGGASDA